MELPSDIGTRAANCLYQHFDKRYPSPEEVAKLSSWELLRIEQCGKTSLGKIKRWLSDYGLTLADDSYSRESRTGLLILEIRRLEDAADDLALPDGDRDWLNGACIALRWALEPSKHKSPLNFFHEEVD